MKANLFIEIEIAGKKIGLKFNMYAFEQSLLLKGQNSNISKMTGIIYAAMLGNAYAKQIEPEATFEEISDFVDANMITQDKDGVLARITDALTDSPILKYLNEKAAGLNGNADDDIKKKISATV